MQKAPRAVLWCVLSGGLLLGCADVSMEQPVDASPLADASIPHVRVPDADQTAALQPDADPGGPWGWLAVEVKPPSISPGGSVDVVVEMKAPAGQSLAGGELTVESRAPDGRTFTGKTSDLAFSTGERKTITQQRGPYSLLGTWRYFATLRDPSGTVLATGPTAGAAMTVAVPTDLKNQTIKLNVPYASQPDGYTCGTTSLHMAMAHYGKTVDINTIGNYQASIGDSPWVEGSLHWSLIATAKHYGFEGTGELTGWERLQEKIVAQQPVLINLRSVINPDSGHYAVVVGLSFDGEGAVSKVYLNDPSGGHKEYSRSYFDSLWAYRDRWGMYLK